MGRRKKAEAELPLEAVNPDTCSECGRELTEKDREGSDTGKCVHCVAFRKGTETLATDDKKAEQYKRDYLTVLERVHFLRETTNTRGWTIFWHRLMNRLAQHKATIQETESSAEWKAARIGKQELEALASEIDEIVEELNTFGESEPLITTLLDPMVMYTAKFDQKTGAITMTQIGNRHKQSEKAEDTAA